MRLIDADFLIQKVKEEEEERHLDKGDASLLHFFIECYAHEVDAVPVIRCKDCRFYKEENLQCMMHEGDTEEWYDNDFCSLAERKEE